MDLEIPQFRFIRRIESALANEGWSVEFRILCPRSHHFSIRDEGFTILDVRTKGCWEMSGTTARGLQTVFAAARDFVVIRNQDEAAIGKLIVLEPNTDHRLFCRHPGPFNAFLVPAGSLPANPNFGIPEFRDLVSRLGLSKSIAESLIPSEDSTQKPESGEAPKSSHALYVRRACEEIDSHLREGLRVPDLSEQVGIGKRTLERAFADILGLTPSRYVHVRRLNAAFRRLIAANPRKDSVTSIALDCGLSHLGRFSRDYLEMFGQLPSEVLRQESPSA